MSPRKPWRCVCGRAGHGEGLLALMVLTPTGSPRTCAQPSTAAWWPRAGRTPGISSGTGSGRPLWCLRPTSSAQPSPAAPIPGSSTGVCGAWLALWCVPTSPSPTSCPLPLPAPHPRVMSLQVSRVHPRPYKDPEAGCHLHDQQHCQQCCGAAPGLGLHPWQLEDALHPVSTVGGWGHPYLPAPLGGGTVSSPVPSPVALRDPWLSTILLSQVWGRLLLLLPPDFICDPALFLRV